MKSPGSLSAEIGLVNRNGKIRVLILSDVETLHQYGREIFHYNTKNPRSTVLYNARNTIYIIRGTIETKGIKVDTENPRELTAGNTIQIIRSLPSCRR